MPLAGFLCELTHEPVTFDECLNCSRTEHPCQFTYEILKGMTLNAESRADAGISITTLLGCLRKGYYSLALPYSQHPSKLWPAHRGTAFHLMMEEHATDDAIYETRFGRSLAGYEVTGKMDKVIPRENRIVDYKTKEKMPTKVPEDYVWQLNGYRWLVENGYVVSPGEKGIVLAQYAEFVIDIDKLGIVFMSMSEVRKYPVPVLDMNLVTDYFGERVLAIGDGLAFGAVPDRGFENPTKSRLCVDFCQFYEMCLES